MPNRISCLTGFHEPIVARRITLSELLDSSIGEKALDQGGLFRSAPSKDEIIRRN